MRQHLLLGGGYIAGIAVCCLLLVNPVYAADALQEVMQALSKVERSETRYREEKHLAMLDLPLLQTGSLSYIAPDRFTRTLDKPQAGSFMVLGDQVTLEKKTGAETHDLNRLPMLRAFIASFGATLAGDLSTLEHYYTINFSGGQHDWRLALQPRDSQLAAYITQIDLWGKSDRIRGMEIHQTNDDWSRMILLHD